MSTNDVGSPPVLAMLSCWILGGNAESPIGAVFGKSTVDSWAERDFMTAIELLPARLFDEFFVSHNLPQKVFHGFKMGQTAAGVRRPARIPPARMLHQKGPAISHRRPIQCDFRGLGSFKLMGQIWSHRQ